MRLIIVLSFIAPVTVGVTFKNEGLAQEVLGLVSLSFIFFITASAFRRGIKG